MMTNNKYMNTKKYEIIFDTYFSKTDIIISIVIIIGFVTVAVLGIIHLYKTLTRDNKYGFLILIGFIFIFGLGRSYINFFMFSIGLNNTIIICMNVIIGGVSPVIISKVLAGCNGKDISFNRNDIIIFLIGTTISYFYICYIYSLCNFILNIFLSASYVALCALKAELLNIFIAGNKICYIVGKLINNYFYNEDKVRIGLVSNKINNPVNSKLTKTSTLFMEGSNIDPSVGINPSDLSISESTNTNISTSSQNLTSNNSPDNPFIRHFYRPGSLFYNLFNGNTIGPKRGVFLDPYTHNTDETPSQTLNESISKAKIYFTDFNQSLPDKTSDNPSTAKFKEVYGKNFDELETMNKRIEALLSSLTPEEKEAQETSIDLMLSHKKIIAGHMDIINVHIKNMSSCNRILQFFPYTTEKYYIQSKFPNEWELIREQLKYISEELKDVNMNRLITKNHPLCPDDFVQSKEAIKVQIRRLVNNIEQKKPVVSRNLSSVFFNRFILERFAAWEKLKLVDILKEKINDNVGVMEKTRDEKLFKVIDFNDTDVD